MTRPSLRRMPRVDRYGQPGSQAIPYRVGILVNALDFGMSAKEAVEHHGFASMVSRSNYIEAPERYPQMESLQGWTHRHSHRPLPQGDAHTIFVEKPHRYIGVTDSRRNSNASAAVISVRRLGITASNLPHSVQRVAYSTGAYSM